MITIKQLAIVVNYIIQLIFVSWVEYSYEKYIISVTMGCFLKDYQWQKIELGTLCFSTNPRLTTPSIYVC